VTRDGVYFLCALVRLTVTPTPLVSVSLFKGVFSANEAGRGLMRGRVWKGRESSAKEQGRLAESCMGGHATARHHRQEP
jgi:hypothetical protein